MSFFSGAKLRRVRELRRMSLTDVYRSTGISRAQISRIENGLSDPRMSTVTALLSCYDAHLSDVESEVRAAPRSLDEVKKRASQAAARLERIGLEPSKPEERLARKAELGRDVEVEREALATRNDP